MTVFGFDHPPSFFEKADPEGEHNLTVLMPHTKHDNNRTGTSRDDFVSISKIRVSLEHSSPGTIATSSEN